MLYNKSILSLLLFIPFCAMAQDNTVWTLEECLDYALENSIIIKRQELVRESKEVSLSDSKWIYIPKVSFSTSATLSFGRVLDMTTYQFVKNSAVGSSSSSISGSMSLFDGFKNVYALQRAKLDLRVEDANLEVVQYDIRRSITAAYLSLLCTQSILESAVSAKQLQESQLNRINDLLNAGLVTESDYLQAKSQLYATESDVSSAEGAVKSAKLTLCQLLEIEDYSSFSVSENDSLPSPPPYDTSTIDIVLSRPEYLASKLAVDLAYKDIAIARSAYFPTISISAGFGSSWSSARQKSLQNDDGSLRFGAYPFFEQYADNRNSYFSIGMSIPVFNAMSFRNNVRQKMIMHRDLQYALHVNEKDLIKEYQQLSIDCQTAYRRYLAAEQRLQYATQAERHLRDRFELGGIDFNTWNISATELAKARYSLSEAKYQYLLKIKLLELFYQ